jgi:hypothetical protein
MGGHSPRHALLVHVPPVGVSESRKYNVLWLAGLTKAALPATVSETGTLPCAAADATGAGVTAADATGGMTAGRAGVDVVPPPPQAANMAAPRKRIVANLMFICWKPSCPSSTVTTKYEATLKRSANAP